MFCLDRFKSMISEIDELLRKGLEAGHVIKALTDNQIEIGFQSLRKSAGRAFTLPLIDGIVVGIDVREWTKRGVAGQVIVAAILNACAVQTVEMFREHGLFDKYDPLLLVPTGDGMYVVFVIDASIGQQLQIWKDHGKKSETGPNEEERIEVAKVETTAKALSFILTLNTLLAQHNARRTFDDSQLPTEEKGTMGITPIYPRFSIVSDKILPCVDINDNLNAIGPGMVTCSRILGTDKGNHFLVHDKLLHECDRAGGIAAVAGRVGLGDWKANLHFSEIPEIPVKSGKFRYADVFGHYSDAPLLRMQGMSSVRPKQYHIGSHDVLRLENSH